MPEPRKIILKPANRIISPPSNVYAPILIPPAAAMVSPIVTPYKIKDVPSTETVPEEPPKPSSPSNSTVCLDEISHHSTQLDHVDINNNAPNEADVISIYAPEEYNPVDTSKSVEETTYTPTPKHILQLKAMAESQKSRIILNVGGSKFETCVPTLQGDPSSILSYMLLPDSPLKPYNVDNIYTYFLDRDPRHFVHILNYLRSNCNSDLSTFPKSVTALRELQRECNFYNLSHLHCLLEKRCLDILQDQLQE